jgi:hypothetical protein
MNLWLNWLQGQQILHQYKKYTRVTRLTGTRIWRHCRSAVVDKWGSESPSAHPRSCMYMSRLGIHNDVLLLHKLPLQSMCSWSYFCFGAFQLYIFALKFQMPCISRWHMYWNLYSSVYIISQQRKQKRKYSLWGKKLRSLPTRTVFVYQAWTIWQELHKWIF